MMDATSNKPDDEAGRIFLLTPVRWLRVPRGGKFYTRTLRFPIDDHI